MPESVVVTFVRLASAVAAGPDVVGVDGDPLGADVLGCDAAAPVGTVTVVPGPLTDVDPLEVPLGAAAFGADEYMVEAVTGSLVATVAGPALPPSADALPPAVGPCGSGRTIGSTETAGPSASAMFPTSRSARTAMSVSTVFML